MADFAGEEKKEEKPVAEEQGEEEEDVNPEVILHVVILAKSHC